MRRLLLVFVLAGLALPSAAHAQSPFERCPRAPAELRCATISVPLDRSGRVPGQIGLEVLRLRVGARGPHLMYLSGGPGGAGLLELVGVLLEVPQLARRYTVLGFDQRGTGASGLLRCPDVERDSRLRSGEAGERCARRLGERRGFYTTPDSVEDMEAIRRAAGVEKLTLFGISYGTLLALEYARTYPQHVERLILDSVADPDDADPFGLAGFRAMRPSLQALCPDGCAGLSADPAADLRALVARLRAESPVRAPVYDARGRRRVRTLRPTAISDLMYDADYAPELRAAIPVAVRAALRGDEAPLLRLITTPSELSFRLPPQIFSSARYATVCEETPLPWARGTPIGDRLGVARSRALALGPAAFAPFDARTALADEIGLCLRWPDPVQPERPAPGPYPAVPTLILQGDEDLRTPPEASARVASLIAGAVRVTAPGVGHATVGSACPTRQLLRFVAGQPVRVTRCPRRPTGVPATAVPPVRIGLVRPARGVGGGRVARTVGALDATLADVALVRSLRVVYRRGGGLRGGSWRLARGGRLRLSSYVVVPGVRVSGVVDRRGRVRLRVAGGAAADGRISVGADGRLRGRLGGRAVSVRLRSWRAAASTLASAATARATLPRAPARLPWGWPGGR